MLVPGICGTELIDPATNAVVWGVGYRQLGKALGGGSVFEQLQDPRLKPTRLLASVGTLPGLGRFEPYTGLSRHMKILVRSHEAFAEYPYDWRNAVAATAEDFAKTAAAHLERWRRHRYGSAEAKLTLIAHSMGGLVCLQALGAHPEILPAEHVREVITLGTPHLGSVKAVRAMATGEVLPVGWAISRKTKARLRLLAWTTPSLYDLLPSFPCTYETGGVITTASLRRLTAVDIADLGGSTDMATAAMTARVVRSSARVKIMSVAGTGQRTLSSFENRGGETEFFDHVGGYEWGGDGTVHFHASRPVGGTADASLSQAHGALAKCEEVKVLLEGRLNALALGPWQSGGGLGLQADEAVERNTPVRIEGRMPEGVLATCSWREAVTSFTGTIDLGPPKLIELADGTKQHVRTGTHGWRSPGLYTITASGGGGTDVSVDVLVEDDE